MPNLSLVRVAAAARCVCAVLCLSALPTVARAQNGPAAPLASFASQRLIVLPVQMLRGDSTSWVTAAGWEKFRHELDDSIGAAISERGVGRRWAYAADVARQSKRNALYTNDPYAIGAQPLRAQAFKVDDKMPETMASGIRTLIALSDARYALVPVELVFERTGERQRAVLRLALVDGRSTAFVWIADAVSDGATVKPAGLAGVLAQRVADFVARRP